MPGQGGVEFGKPDGVTLIGLERQRQIDVERWTPEHDDTHTDDEFLLAAGSYISATMGNDRTMPSYWPWADETWKPAEPMGNLVKAGALIAAEIDRIQRREAADGKD